MNHGTDSLASRQLVDTCLQTMMPHAYSLYNPKLGSGQVWENNSLLEKLELIFVLYPNIHYRTSKNYVKVKIKVMNNI